MNKIVYILFLCGGVLLTTNRASAQFIRAAGNEAPAGWQNGSYEQEGHYGADIDGARELLAEKTARKTVTVALIGYGLDVSNENIRPSLWTNPKEKADGRDNDRNGLTDDIHGWNFLGTPDGKTIDTISRAADREFLRLVDKYGDYMNFSGIFYRYDRATDSVHVDSPPENPQEYFYFRDEVVPDSPDGGSYLSIPFTALLRQTIRGFDRELRRKYPGKALTQQDFYTIVDQNATDTLLRLAYMFTEMAFNYGQTGGDWDKMLHYQLVVQKEHGERMAQQAFERLQTDDRTPIGDDPYDRQDNRYGNNNLMAGNAGFGTMLAGIIAAKPTEENALEGIASRARIMVLRVEADLLGEPYMKDLALAVRYAVDHGAEIIQLNKSNSFYPRPESAWVDEALQYAEEKGVLVVIPAMDYGFNTDEVPFYPNRNLRSGEVLTNVITVAASDAKGNPKMDANFGAQTLDLFAPGIDIRSAYLGNRTATSSGSHLAAAMVTGVAALLKTYYPAITPEQMRALLMDSATTLDTEVEKQYIVLKNGKATSKVKDLFLFEELSVSGGLLNARKAAEEAANRF